MPQAKEALSHWGYRDPVLRVAEGGLINRTWIVGEPPQAVLQWVNPIFDPLIHHDIDAVTARLEEVGLLTPRLLPTTGGDLFATNREGCWRLLSYIPGTTLHRLESTAQAAAAGDLAGRFHTALAGLHYRFRAPRRYIHDTTHHMAELHAACAAAGARPLAAEVREVGQTILEKWSRWDGEMVRHRWICHGDLKISNLRFDAAGRRAVSLVDFDTVGSMPIACEMGDAWRSWCNPAGEDDPESSRFETRLFAASARAWLAAAPPMDADERRSLVPGIERICLELAARFCADAVRNTYFREDEDRYPQRGLHNLVRARGQLALARSARDARDACEDIVRSA